MSTYKHEASGAELCRELAQPNVDRFAEIFEDWKPFDLMGHKAKHAFESRYIRGQSMPANLYKNVAAAFQGLPQKRHSDETMSVGPFCSHSRKGPSQWFSVRCCDWVLSRIKERTVLIPNDRMSFELVDHDNGWTLVMATHSQILGSVWLAYIKAETIPNLTT